MCYTQFMPNTKQTHRRIEDLAGPHRVSVVSEGDQTTIHGSPCRIEALLASIAPAPHPQPGHGQLYLFDPNHYATVSCEAAA